MKVRLLGVLVLLAGAHAAAAAEAGVGTEAARVRAGERLYREGMTPGGAPLVGTLRGGAVLRGASAACVTCHRRSGMGGSEGATVVPPITGAALWRPREPAVEQLAYLSSHIARRPAYTKATLARLMRDGVDAAGRKTGDPMPRYALSAAELDSLLGYLDSLSPASAPGVTDDTLHFASVVTEGVTREKREAMVEVLEAFFRDKNGGTRYERRRATHGPWSMKGYTAWRRWKLHLWELRGPAESWRAQLERHYREQPVFALVSGMASGGWDEIDQFCESNRIPCLFPSTDLPGGPASGFYTRYLSAGMALEGRVAARHLREEGGHGPVIQVVGGASESVAAAAAFREAWGGDQRRALEELQLKSGAPGPEFWRTLLQGRSEVQLVLWLDRVDWDSLRPWAGAVEKVVVSGTLMDSTANTLHATAVPVVAVERFVPPGERGQKLARIHAWLARNGIAPREERVQADAYFAATVAADGVMKMSFNFSRDYFLERVEDMVDSAVTSSIYPRASLGVGQRYASKGAWVSAPGERVWVVP